MVSLTSEGSVLALDGYARLDSDTLDEAAMTMRQAGSLSEDRNRLIAEAGAACGAD
jgi:hypothetical protein